MKTYCVTTKASLFATCEPNASTTAFVNSPG